MFLDARIGDRFHAIYRLLETHDHGALTNALELHLVELPRLSESTAEEPVELLRWVRFLRVRDSLELDSLAREDPIMARAKEALEQLSEDPEARRVAEARLKARANLAVIHRQGVEEGLELARSALRQAVLDVLTARGFALDDAARARVAAETDIDILSRWVASAAIATDVAGALGG